MRFECLILNVVVVLHEFRKSHSLLARNAAFDLRSMAQCNGDDLHPCDLHGLDLGACFGASNFGQVGPSPSRLPPLLHGRCLPRCSTNALPRLASTAEVANAAQEAFKLASNAYDCLKTHFGDPSPKVHATYNTRPHSVGVAWGPPPMSPLGEGLGAWWHHPWPSRGRSRVE